jgi:cardiolipin synthase
MIGSISIVIVICYYILVLGIAAGVILDNRNPAKTLAYLLVLLFVPVVGLVVYVLFGQNIRKQKLFSRKGLLDIERIQRWEDSRITAFEESSQLAKRFLHEKFKVASLLLKNDRAVITLQNNLEVLHECSVIFNRMFADMRLAKHHLHVEFYIIDDDEIGNEFKALLIKKAKEGVEVRLCFDDVGSRKLPQKFIKELKSAGVEVFTFMPVFFPYLTGKANFRNHRKIVVIDGELGYIGGINIADRYTNKQAHRPYWRDTQLRIYGESVKMLQMQFMLNWNFVSGKQLIINQKYFPEVAASQNHLVQIAASGPDSDWPSIMQGILMAINTAEKYIYITTPYFIPNEEVTSALQIAALSGIDVQVLIPKMGDSTLTQAASMSYVRQMLEAGVKVFRYTKGFIHAKTIVVDNVVSTIGTTNMDNRSFNLNFEINAFCYDAEIAKGLYEQFLRDKETSEEILLARWQRRRRTKRVVESLARMFAPLL